MTRFVLHFTAAIGSQVARALFGFHISLSSIGFCLFWFGPRIDARRVPYARLETIIGSEKRVLNLTQLHCAICLSNFCEG